MRHHPWARRTLLSVLIAAIGMPPLAGAEQLSLVQFPPGSSSKQPTPNVIITLDDSSSMRYNLAGKDLDSIYGSGKGEARPESGMYALKAALQEAFSATSQAIPDGSIRMAWHSMNNCRAIPTSSGGCGSKNGMRVLDATHRANFLNWVGAAGTNKNTAKLHSEGGTPTHQTFITAGDYYKNGSTTDKNSPWASVPGTTPEPFLSCRRSYNVLMTDGGWSWEGTASNLNAGASRPSVDKPNADGLENKTMPDKIEVYDITKDYTRIYRDAYGGLSQGRTYNSTKMTAGAVSTLADLAFHYWSTDLSTLDNKIVPTWRRRGSETVTSTDTTKTVDLPEYWNPKNNPATWQHMTTYTIGFRDAASWPNNGTYPNWDAASNDTFGEGGSYKDLVTGARIWPDPMGSDTLVLTAVTEETRKTELWHMAINSRGKFIPTYSAADMVRAFKDIFGEIGVDNKQPVTSFANASTSIARSATTQYTSGYFASKEVGNDVFKWMGYVSADTLTQNATTGAVTVTPDATWGTKTAATPPNTTTADKLDALSELAIPNRLVLTWSEAGRGTSFQWTQDIGTLSALTSAQKDFLREGSGVLAELAGEQRLNFIRGHRLLEGTTFRKRGSRQGDIVNSALWYVADPVSNYSFDKYITTFAKTHKDRLPMVYVGGNDGMLHGFSGVDGSEKIAYVPKGVFKTLPELTRSDYDHRYYVDGSPFSGDVNWGTSATPNWRTLLVGTLGAGGKGYFVLDVTTPGSKATDETAIASNFQKTNAASLVVMDKTSPAGATTEDADIGHIMVAPVLEDNNPQKTTQIVRMNDGRWALVMGNGYNSTNERPVLLIQYLSGEDRSLRKIVAVSAGPEAATNGLSAPRLVDIDGNGTPDVVYAGDLRGNLWKFDVSSATPADWNVAFSQTPLFTALRGTTPQPITAPPLVRANERGAGGLMVAFGTGRNITEADRTSTAGQSIYSVLDNTRYKLVAGKVAIDRSTVEPAALGSDLGQLVQQTVGNTKIAGALDSAARSFWTISQNDVAYSGANLKKGWYLNLPETGERVLAQMSFYDESNIIELMTEVPASGGVALAEESCAPPPTDLKKFRTLLNIMDGKRPSVQVMDTNGNGTYDGATDMYASRMTASDTENRVTTKTQEIRLGHNGQAGMDKLARLPEIPLRPNWRQLQ